MKTKYLYACALALLLAACGKQMPKDVIPTDRMERILYDYHLSNAMQSTVSHNDNVKKEAMRRYVFSKHGVTEEQFDSSMVWYARHPEELAKIYNSLGQRFKAEGEQVTHLLASRDEGMTLSLPGDTVDMWHGDPYYLLQGHNPLCQMLTFTMEADTNFQANDAIRWTANYDFGKDVHSVVRMGLSVVYDNDSVAGEVKNVVRSGSKSIYLPQDSAYSIRRIHGFIYVPVGGTNEADIIVHDMELMRYHVPFDSTKLQKPAVDSLKTDSAKVGMDSIQEMKLTPDTLTGAPKRLSPTELKKGPHKSAHPVQQPVHNKRNTSSKRSVAGTPRKR